MLRKCNLGSILLDEIDDQSIFSDFILLKLILYDEMYPYSTTICLLNIWAGIVFTLNICYEAVHYLFSRTETSFLLLRQAHKYSFTPVVNEITVVPLTRVQGFLDQFLLNLKKQMNYLAINHFKSNLYIIIPSKYLIILSEKKLTEIFSIDSLKGNTLIKLSFDQFASLPIDKILSQVNTIRFYDIVTCLEINRNLLILFTPFQLLVVGMNKN